MLAMAKRKRRVIRSINKKSLNLAKPIARATILVLGGLVGIVLTFTTVAVTLAFAWLTASGGWHGKIEIWDRTITINPTLEAVLAWTIVVSLVIASISFLNLIFRLYRGH